MPGENIENQEAREKARAEAAAIANGENFNPNLSAEAAAGFENLGNDVPFAGEIIEDAGESSQTPSEMAIKSTETHDSDNAIAQKFNEQWDTGKVPNLDDVQEEVGRDYINGAIEQSAINPNTQADIADAKRNSTEDGDKFDQQISDQPHDISEAATIQAVSASALSENIADKIKAGDEEAIAQISEVEQRTADAQTTAEKISTASQNNSNNTIEAQMATAVAAQAQEKAAEAIETVEAAKNEYDSMSEEEKAETQAAAEAAEANGTTIEEEKAKAEEKEEEEEEKFTPDLSKGIFG